MSEDAPAETAGQNSDVDTAAAAADAPPVELSQAPSAASAEPMSQEPAGRAPKLSKADKLVARAEQLREREAQRAAERQAQAAYPAAGARPTGWIIATSLVSVVALALATVLVIGFISWHHQRQLNDARSASLKAAESYAIAFGTYNYQHLDADFDKTSQLLTPSFAKRYEATSNALAKTFAAYKTKVTASIPSGAAAVISVSMSKAQVLVLLDQVITNSQSKTPTINRNRLKVTLVHTDGKWLVSSTDAT